MDFSENLKYYRKYKGVTQKELADAIGTNNTTLSNWEKDISKPDIDTIVKLSNYFGISIDDLVFFKNEKNGNENGKVYGKVSNKNAQVNAHLSEKYTSPILKEDIETIKGQPVIYSHKPSIKAVPYYDLPVSAGPLGLIDVGDGRDAAGYVDLPAFYGCEEILPVLGISMEPLIYSGDFIGVKSITNLSTRWDFLQTGKIYLIVTREERMIKYLNEASDSENIICSSPNYTSFKVHKRDILEIHRVVAVARGL